MSLLYCLLQALVRSMNSAAACHQQSLVTSPTSLIDTFRQISLPGDVAAVSCVVPEDSHSALELNIARSSQSAVTTAGYFVPSPDYLSPAGSIETAALRELQAFAGGGGMEHVSAQSPDTTDSAGGQGCSESSSIGQSTCSVTSDDNSHGMKELQLSPSPSICTMCGRGCRCYKQSEDTVYRRLSQDSIKSWNFGLLKVESKSTAFDSRCECAAQSSSPSSWQHQHQQQQQQQSQHSDIMTDMDMFLTPLELSNTLNELSIAAREPPTGSTADLIEHTIQAVVDAHFSTCLYTSDKVAAGLRDYELMLSTKPLVRHSVYVKLTAHWDQVHQGTIWGTE